MTLYDAVADRYDTHFRRPVDLAEDDVLYDWVRPHADGATVLDVGCGTGAALDRLRPDWYFGVDESERMIARAREKFDALGSPLSFHVGSADDLPVGSGVFDCAICLWAFPYFAHQVGSLMGMHRAVRPGGRVIVQGWAARYRDRQSHITRDATIHTTSPQWLASRMHEVGFRVRWVRGLGHLPDDVHNVAGRHASRRLTKLTSRVLPIEWALTHVICGEVVRW